MSLSEFARFLNDLKTDAALRAEVTKSDSVGAVVGVAARHGYAVTLDEAQAHVKAHLKVQAVARAAAAGRSLSARELDAIAAGTTHDVEELAEKELERIAGGSTGKLQEAEDRTRVIAEKELAGISGGGSGGSIEVGRMIGGIFVPPDLK
jgi:hypothetical protein